MQGFDGLALGSAFINANFSKKRYIVFGVLFVLVNPIGIAIGMGISRSYAPGSRAALGCEAIFNSISAGIFNTGIQFSFIISGGSHFWQIR